MLYMTATRGMTVPRVKPAFFANGSLADRVYAGLITGSAVTTALVEPDLTISWISESVIDLIGVPASSLINTSALSLVHPEDVPELSALIAAELMNPQDYRTRLDPARMMLNRLRFRHATRGWVAVDLAANNEVGNSEVNGFIVQLIPSQSRLAYDKAVDAILHRQPAAEIAEMIASAVEAMIERCLVVVNIDGVQNACHPRLAAAVEHMRSARETECVTPRGSLWRMPVYIEHDVVGCITVAVPLEMPLTMWAKTTLKDLAPLVSHTVRRDRVEQSLAAEASTDPLTGLANRRHFFRSTERQPPSLRALIYIDLDGFKEINDRLGHDAGDASLIEASHRIVRALRPRDLVARFGGDEFVVCCEIETTDEGLNIADRILQRISTEPFAVDGGSIALAATIGVSVGKDEPITSLVRRADVAMVGQKQLLKGTVALVE
jgi:diguanylate cyclase (GGDEF)-like protein